MITSFESVFFFSLFPKNFRETLMVFWSFQRVVRQTLPQNGFKFFYSCISCDVSGKSDCFSLLALVWTDSVFVYFGECLLHVIYVLCFSHCYVPQVSFFIRHKYDKFKHILGSIGDFKCSFIGIVKVWIYYLFLDHI